MVLTGPRCPRAQAPGAVAPRMETGNQRARGCCGWARSHPNKTQGTRAVGILDKLPGANVPHTGCAVFLKPRLSGGLGLCPGLGGTRRDSAHGGAEGKAPPCLPAPLALLCPSLAVLAAALRTPGMREGSPHRGAWNPGAARRPAVVLGCAASGFRNCRMSTCVPVRWTTGGFL